ncbi:hypothetical protein quinque_001539 [Culex quinquefasciatus]
MGRGRPKRENPANGDAPAAKVARTSSTKFELPLPALPTLSGNVLSCGQGEVGQLGLGEDVFEKTRPALIPSLRDIVDISAGGMHNLCLTRRGEVYSFGCNDEGALGRATADEEGSEFEPRRIELPAPFCKDGEFRVEWFSPGESQGLFGNATINVPYFFVSPPKQDSHGNMGLTLEGNKRLPIEVIPGVKSHHTLILKTDNKVHVIGRKEYGRLGLGDVSEDAKTVTPVPALADKKVTEICCGESTSFAITDKGELYAWGMGSNQQLGTGNEEDEQTPVQIASKQVQGKRILKVSSGGQHSLFIVEEAPTKEATPVPDPKPAAAAKSKKEEATSSTTKTNGTAPKEAAVNGGDEASDDGKDATVSTTTTEEKKPAARGRKRKL